MTRHRSAHQQLCLACVPPAGAPEMWALPPQPTWIVHGPGRRPNLSAHPPASGAAAAIVEPLLLPGRQPRLLVISPAASRGRVNGLPAPCFAVLKDNDCLHLAGDFTLQVALFNQPAISAADTEVAGRECPVCRVKLATGVRCYTCACGAVMHCEEDGEDSLQCAQLRARAGCPVCQRPMVLEAGYSYQPEPGDE